MKAILKHKSVLTSQDWGSAEFYKNQLINLEENKEYVILGLKFKKSGDITCFFEVFDGGYVLSIPSIFFTVTNPKPSHYWQFKDTENYIQLASEVLLEPYFKDDFSNGVKEVRLSFDKMFRLMTQENS